MIQKFIKQNKMKSIFKLGFISLFTVLIACGGNKENEEEQPSENPTAEVSAENLMMADYKIDGMVCAMGCAKTIEEEIGSIEGVTASFVDFESGKAHFEFDKTIVSENNLISKIESIADGQYKVSAWEDEVPVEDVETETEDANKESVAQHANVSLKNIEIPNLFTYLIKNL